MSAPEPVCRDIVAILTEYLENALPREQRARVDEHLADCEECTRYLEQLRATIAATGRLAAPPVDPALRARLIAAFRGFDERGTPVV